MRTVDIASDSTYILEDMLYELKLLTWDEYYEMRLNNLMRRYEQK